MSQADVEQSTRIISRSVRNQRVILNVAQRLHAMHCDRSDIPDDLLDVLELIGGQLDEFEKVLVEQERMLGL